MPDTWKRACRQVWLSSWSMRRPDRCLRQIVAPLSSLVCCNPPLGVPARRPPRL